MFSVFFIFFLSINFYLTHSNVVQIKMFCMPLRLDIGTKLTNFFLVFLQLCVTKTAIVESILVACIWFQKTQHQLQTVAIQVHCKSILTQYKHDGCRAQAEALFETVESFIIHCFIDFLTLRIPSNTIYIFTLRMKCYVL